MPAVLHQNLFWFAAVLLLLLLGVGRSDIASIAVDSSGDQISVSAGSEGETEVQQEEGEGEQKQRHEQKHYLEEATSGIRNYNNNNKNKDRPPLDRHQKEHQRRHRLSKENRKKETIQRRGSDGSSTPTRKLPQQRHGHQDEDQEGRRGRQEEGQEDRQGNNRNLGFINGVLRPRRTEWLIKDKINEIFVEESEKPLPQEPPPQPANLLFIVSDQLRYDGVRYMQDRLNQYKNVKLKINTPNIDKLSSMGVTFETAYCVSPSCAPARATFRTGNSLQRAAIKGNKMVNSEVYKRMRFVEEAVQEMETFEQILVEEKGYVAETYGKWHVPLPLYYSRPSYSEQRRRIIDYNDYDFATDTPQFEPLQHFKPFYQRSVKHIIEKLDQIEIPFRNGQQRNYFSRYPYTPIRLDARYGYPTNTPLKEEAGFERYQLGNSNVCGRDSLDVNHTSTAVLGMMAEKSLDRLIARGKPWSLSVHFNAPHPPMVATPHYLNRYWSQRFNLLVQPSIDDDMRGSAYKQENGRQHINDRDYGYNNPNKMAELTAVYYAMIEEVDHWVGELVGQVERAGLMDKTLIIFTADHGEMLGSHGMVGKGILLEESTRVPLVMRYDGAMPAGRTVEEPVSHMDIFSTMLDYMGAPVGGFTNLDRSDGRSLRRYIDKTSFNQAFDDRVVVAEMDKRVPISNREFSRQLGDEPNLMIRKGGYVLILPKKADSHVLDMMYHLPRDPFQMKNLLASNGSGASDRVIAKAEHLKVLLVEWLRRMDGSKSYYSNKMFNNDVGNGDIAEIRNRRTWRSMGYWISVEVLRFGRPTVLNGGALRARNEYLYVGRTSQGTLVVTDVSVVGQHAGYFDVGDTQRATIEQNGYLRIKVSYRSLIPLNMTSIDASIKIQLQGYGTQTIKIIGEGEFIY